MTSHRGSPPKSPARSAGRYVLLLLLSWAGPPAPAAEKLEVQWRPCAAEQAPPPTPVPARAAPAGTAPLTLGLADCLHLALERQPRIAAQRASLTAAEDGLRALEALRVPVCLARDLPVRRHQAALGVTAAAAGLDGAERDVVYAVTRTYFTVIYARQQEQVARGVVERLTATQRAAKEALDAGARDVTAADAQRATVYLHLAQTRRIQATEGAKRALAALKEAVGLAPGVCLDVPPGQLPEPTVRPCLGDVVAAALARRGDLARAGIFAEVAGLEVEAQGIGCRRRKPTFAAGADIHAAQVPQGMSNTEYRPGAVPPEMPTLLIGTPPDRVQRACSLSARAGAVTEVTRNLIALEAEDAFLRWEEAAEQARAAREGAETGAKMADALSRDLTSGLRVRVEDVINANVLASQARSQYNEYLYHEILALADLERVTAGAFCAGLPGAPAPRAAQAPANEAKNQ